MKISFFVYKRRGSMNGYQKWKTRFPNYLKSKHSHQTLPELFCNQYYMAAKSCQLRKTLAPEDGGDPTQLGRIFRADNERRLY